MLGIIDQTEENAWTASGVIQYMLREAWAQEDGSSHELYVSLPPYRLLSYFAILYSSAGPGRLKVLLDLAGFEATGAIPIVNTNIP